MSSLLSPVSSSLPAKIPNLYHHVGGHFYVRIGKKTKWFGKDRTQAQIRYSAWILETFPASSQTVQSNRDVSGESLSSPISREVPATSEPFQRGSKKTPLPTWEEIAKRLYVSVDSETTKAGQVGVRARLVPFLNRFGKRPIDSLSPDELISWRAEYVSAHAPNSSCGVLTYTRRLLTFAFEIGAIETPYRLAILKNPPRGALKLKAIGTDKLKTLLEAVTKENPNIGKMMYVQFLCTMRPSELPKLIYGVGHWEGTGKEVFSMEGKTTRKTGEARRVLVTPRALEVLKGIEKRCPTMNAYRLACRKVGEKLNKKRPGFVKSLTGRDDLSGHFLRHSSATALANANTPDSSIRVAMGRSLGRVDRTYRPENYRAARKDIEILSELLPLNV